MTRGSVFDARLDPIGGSEQGGLRPIVVVSRDAINEKSSVIIGVPCTSHRPGRRIFSTQVLLRAGDGGLDVDSIALGEQVRAIAKSRLGRHRGVLSQRSLAQLDNVLLISLDLPGQR